MRALAAVLVLLPAASHAQENAGAVNFSYVYEQLDEGTGRTAVDGWSAGFSVVVKKWLSAVGDFSNYYGTYRGNSQNVHTFLFGPSFSYPNASRFVPFVFVVAGDARNSIRGAVTNAFEVAAGGGVNVRLTKRVLIKIVPAEYLAAFPKGGARHNFKTAIGVEFPIPKSLFHRR